MCPLILCFMFWERLPAILNSVVGNPPPGVVAGWPLLALRL